MHYFWEDGNNTGSLTISSGLSYSEEVCPTPGTVFEVSFTDGSWTVETSFTMTNTATGAVYTGIGTSGSRLVTVRCL